MVTPSITYGLQMTQCCLQTGDSIQHLQRKLKNVTYVSNKYGLTLNVKKTKYMVILKTTGSQEHLYANGEDYVGTNVNASGVWRYCSKVRIRIDKARA